MKLFLNGFMSNNRNLETHSKKNLDKIFYPTISVINKVLSEDAFKIIRGINTAVFDAVMVGVATRIKVGEITEESDFKQAYYELINDEDFASLTRGGTTDEATVKNRINMAIKKFSTIL